MAETRDPVPTKVGKAGREKLDELPSLFVQESHTALGQRYFTPPKIHFASTLQQLL